MRERRPGVWEIRIAWGTDPATGRTRQRSFTFRGSAEDAAAYRSALAADAKAWRSVDRPDRELAVAELLERWLAADHPWKPSRRIGYASNARYLGGDAALAHSRAVDLTPRVVSAAFARWEAAGATASVIGGRFRVLRSAVGWAYDERIIDTHPLR